MRRKWKRMLEKYEPNPYADRPPDEFTQAEKVEREALAEEKNAGRTFRPPRTDMDLKGIFPGLVVAGFVDPDVPFVDLKKVNGRLRAFIPVGTSREFLVRRCVPYAYEILRTSSATGVRIPIPAEEG